MSNLLDMIPQLSSSIITNYQVEENLLYIVFNIKKGNKLRHFQITSIMDDFQTCLTPPATHQS